MSDYLKKFLMEPEDGLFDDEKEVAALVMTVYEFGIKLGTLGGKRNTQAEKIALFESVETTFELWLDHKRSGFLFDK